MTFQSKLFAVGLFIIIALSAVVHWQWLARSGFFTWEDWWYLPNQYFLESLSWPKLLNGSEEFTAGFLTPMFLPLIMIGGLLAKIGHAFPIWERILFLWPIAFIGAVPMYILLYRKYRSVAGAIAGTLMYAFNSYILVRGTAHLYIALGYLVFAPLLFIALDKVLKKPSLKTGTVFTSIAILFSVYEIRILYICVLMLFAHLAYQFFTKKIRISGALVTAALCSTAIIMLAQSYWLIPFLFAKNSLGYSTFASRGLFQNFTTIHHALVLSDYSWTGSAFVQFATHEIPRFAYGIPLLAFAWILAKPRKEKSHDLWFWTLVACVGIFLAKQADPPFPHAYQWIFEHVPGFNLFRDATKFYLYIGFAYAILIAGTISFLQKRRKSYIIAPLLFIGVIIAGYTAPFIQDTIGGVTIAYTMPKEYEALQHIIEQDAAFGRSLWIPSFDRFIFHSETHPRVNAVTSLQGDWASFVQNQQDIYSLFGQKNAKALLNFGSIAYVGTPLDTTHGIYQWYNRTQENFDSLIANIPGLHEIPQQESSMRLWKNNEAKPHIYIADDVALHDISALHYTGSDTKKTSATIFKPDISSTLYASFQNSLATSWESQPFSLDNIAVVNNHLQTTIELPQKVALTTTDKDTEARPFIPSDIEIPAPPEYTPDNIIVDESFHNESQYSAGDCANVDSTSVSENGIESKIYEENGKRSLVLKAKQHVGCVALAMHAPDPAFNYLLSLQYKTIRGSGPAIAFYPTKDQVAARQELPTYKDLSWHTFKTIIPGNTLQADSKLFLYTSNIPPSEVAFSDIRIIKVPPLPQRYITSSAPALPSLHEEATTINPALHVISSDHIDTPRLLVLSDRYDAEWKLFVRPQGSKNVSWWQRIMRIPEGVEISKNTHIKANAFVNGWVLDPQEIQSAIGQNTSPEFILEYWPQRFMDIGTAISLATIALSSITVLCALVIQQIRRGRVPSSTAQ